MASPSGAEAVGRITTRGRSRPVAASSPRSNSAMGARNSPAPTSATGPGIGRSIEQGRGRPPARARARARPDGRRRDRRCDTRPHARGDTVTKSQRWTMVAAILGSAMVFLDGTVMNLALPQIGEELPATVVSVLEGQTYAVSRLPRDPRRAARPRRRARRLLRAAPDLRDRPRPASASRSVLCGLAPTLELLVVFRLLQGATGALLVPGSLAILTALFEGQARARAFGIWASATSATSLIGPVVGGLLVDTRELAGRVPDQRPARGDRPVRDDPPHARDARPRARPGSFDWLGALVAFIAVGGLAFGAIRGQDKQWQDPLAWVVARRSARSPSSRSRSSWPAARTRSSRSACSGGARFATINLSTLLIYGALYTIALFQGLFLQNTVGYTATAAGVIGLPTGIMLTLLSARVGTRGRADRRAPVPRRRADRHGRRAVLVRAGARRRRSRGRCCRATRRRGSRRCRRSSTSCPTSCCSGSGSRSSSRR